MPIKVFLWEKKQHFVLQNLYFEFLDVGKKKKDVTQFAVSFGGESEAWPVFIFLTGSLSLHCYYRLSELCTSKDLSHK